jgi:hypothetical protein
MEFTPHYNVVKMLFPSRWIEIQESLPENKNSLVIWKNQKEIRKETFPISRSPPKTPNSPRNAKHKDSETQRFFLGFFNSKLRIEHSTLKIHPRLGSASKSVSDNKTVIFSMISGESD